jgi:hypothetical protein
MNSFQNKLISTFKSFVSEKTNLQLDFRTHVFLDNQYGATPCYRYSDAESLIDCLFEFFDMYYVDYSGRYNRSMSIEGLRTQRLNDFLLAHLESEIEQTVFNAVNTKDKTTVISDMSLNIDFSDTVEVQATNAIGETETFHVQTTDGLHRSDLGCWLLTSTSDGDIDQDDYPFFDFGLIVSKAEKFVQAQYEIKETNNSDLYLKVYCDKVEVVEINRNFINQDQSSYQTEYTVIEEFEDEDGAIEYIASL